MSEREKQIINTIAKALPNMSEFDKGYMLGIAEGSTGSKDKQQEETEENTV